jgi:hypothetical protein
MLHRHSMGEKIPSWTVGRAVCWLVPRPKNLSLLSVGPPPWWYTTVDLGRCRQVIVDDPTGRAVFRRCSRQRKWPSVVRSEEEGENARLGRRCTGSGRAGGRRFSRCGGCERTRARGPTTCRIRRGEYGVPTCRAARIGFHPTMQEPAFT